MSAPSTWPLPDTGIRFLTPTFMIEELARHPLTHECYPTAMGYYPGAAGHRMERASPDDNLLIYCTDGRGFLRVGSWEGSIGPGQLVMLPRHRPHVYKADATTPWTLYWVHFNGSASESFMAYLGFRADRPVVEAGVSPLLSGGFANLMEVRRTGYSLGAFIKSANQLRHLFSQLALDLGDRRSRGRGGLDLAKVQAYMQEHMHQTLSLDQLAASVGMSKYHFSARYRALSGTAPVRHFLNMKMEHACSLLDSTELGVSAIAERLGYDDPLYFSRLFRRTIGRSPRAYRASIRED